MTDAKKLLDQRRDLFIATRRDIEVWVDKFFKEISQVNPKLMEGIEAPNGTTAQELFPSLYSEPFDEEKYNAEYEVFNAYYLKVMEVAKYLNDKAQEVLKG